eukprot:Em0005g1664a
MERAPKVNVSHDEKQRRTTVAAKWSIKNWLILINERAPPIVYLLLAAGACLSGLQLFQDRVAPWELSWGIVGQLPLLFLIRLMDEVKDFEKDKVVHPERPLPRGLIEYSEVVSVIHAISGALVLYSLMLAAVFGPAVGVAYFLQVFYVLLMYVEFGIGEWLDQFPVLYGITHQAVIYLGVSFVAALCGVHWSLRVLMTGSVAFSGFFTYEVCRKLDPMLPKLKGTYLVVCGKWKTFAVTVVTVAVGAVSSYVTGLHWLLWPMEAILLLSLLALFLLPIDKTMKKAHKPVELLSVLYLLLHLWAGYLSAFF